MRYFVIAFLFTLASSVASAQIAIEISGLAKSKTISRLAATQANLTTVSIPRPRGGGSSDQTVWIITRNQDQYSQLIQDANDRGRVLKNVVLTIGNNRQVLNQVLVSNYTMSASTTGATETFYFQFSTN